MSQPLYDSSQVSEFVNRLAVLPRDIEHAGEKYLIGFGSHPGIGRKCFGGYFKAGDRSGISEYEDFESLCSALEQRAKELAPDLVPWL